MTRLITMLWGRRGPSALAAVLFGLAAGRAEAGYYSITDLGNLGTSISIGPGSGGGPGFGGGGNINASGQVTGYYSYSGGDSGFLASGGTMTSIPSLGSSYSFAYGINNSGQVVGISGSDAFLYNSSTHTLVDLTVTDHVTLGGSVAQANGINDSGQIVGQARNSSANQAFVYSGGTMTNLSTSAGGGAGYAEAINAGGQITGQQVFTGTNAGTHAFLYTGGTGAADTGGTMKNLGTIGGSTGTSIGYDVNASGEVVGESMVNNGSIFHAFVYNGTSMVDLFSGSTYTGYNSQAFAIDTAGDVAGVYSSSSFSGTHGFLDTYSNGVYTLTDLNSLISPTSGWTITGAYGINDNGQIDVIASNGTSSHVLLLTAPLLVPEPPTIALLCSGAVVGLGLRRLSRRIKAEELAAEPAAE